MEFLATRILDLMGYFFDRIIKPAFAIFAVFAAAGICALPAKKWAELSAPKGVDLSTIRASVGGASLFAVLGGYRSLAADLVWIKGYVEWERKELAPCITSIELATEINPYAVGLWTQGASIIAFDTPHWIVDKEPLERRTDEFFDSVKRRQSKLAIKFIDKGLKIFPDSEEMLLQKGQIAIGAGFFDVAEECYAKVASMPDPQIYVRRIYASLLAKNGKFKEALPVLESVLRDIDADSPLMQILPDQIEKTKELIKKTRL